MRLRQFTALVTLLIISQAGCSSCPKDRDSEPLTPQEALQSFHINDDFRIELFAAEPDVTDPVEMVFDEQGRIWVAEMLDYPYGPDQGQPPRSRIRLLEDTDGDGHVDQSTIFAEGLLHATSVLPWKGGLLVTAAPDILYLKDTDGDNQADVRQVLFTGFNATVDPESRITNLRFNIDNWIYASNNGQPGNITFTEDPDEAPLSVLGADFRFRLDRALFQAASGPTQFGQAINDWGHRFITNNTVHVRHVVMPRRYLERNPFLVAEEASQDISDHGRPSVRVFQLTSPQYWRQVRTEMRQRRYREQGLDQIRELNPSTEIASGYFTGAAGGTIYWAEVFPPEYRGNLFTGDVSTNIIHRDVLRPAGVSHTASRASREQDREFLASTDPWFRPCNFTVGPDGYLYVVDMYREFVETPASIPEELKKEMDFYSGSDRGRIYRIVPRNSARPPVKPDLHRSESLDLVRHLSHPGGWWRFTAQRLLLERQDPSVSPAVRDLVLKGDTPQARLHALYVLEGLSALDAALVEAALGDPEPGVREHAVILAERYPTLFDRLLGMVEDSSQRVVFQLALSLGELGESKRVLSALAAIAFRLGEDPWFRRAVLSSKAGSSVDLLDRLLGQTNFFQEPTSGRRKFVEEISAVIGARNEPRDVARLLRLLVHREELRREQWQEVVLAGLKNGFELAKVRQIRFAGAEDLLNRLITSQSEKVRTAARSVARHFEMRSLLSASKREALDERLPAGPRQAAIEHLAGGSFAEVRPVFEELLARELPESLLQAVIRTLALFEDPEISGLLISGWRTFGPEVRNQVLDVLLGHGRRIPALLNAIETGRIEAAALDLPRREKLWRYPDAEVSRRATKLFGQPQGDRSGIVRQFHGVLELEGEVARGRQIFQKHCASCHFPQEGKRVGPDLSGVSSKTKFELLQAILDPSAAIEARYRNYIVITQDGRIHDGLIVGETPGTLTLRNGEGEDESVLKIYLREMRVSSVSLMPEGFEDNVGPQDLADLIAFLRGANLRPE